MQIDAVLRLSRARSDCSRHKMESRAKLSHRPALQLIRPHTESTYTNPADCVVRSPGYENPGTSSTAFGVDSDSETTIRGKASVRNVYIHRNRAKCGYGGNFFFHSQGSVGCKKLHGNNSASRWSTGCVLNGDNELIANAVTITCLRLHWRQIRVGNLDWAGFTSRIWSWAITMQIT